MEAAVPPHEIRKASTVEVTVTDRAAGAPLGNAHVGVFLCHPVAAGGDEQDRRVVLLEGRTDDAGRATFQVHLGTDEQVEVKAVVRARGHQEWRPPEARLPRRRDLVPTAGPMLGAGGTVQLDVALERGTTLKGTVKDAFERGLEGVHIGLVLSHAHGCSWPHAFGASRSVRWPPPVRTDAGGAFEWLSFPIEFALSIIPGAHYVLLAEDEEHAPAMAHSIETLPSNAEGEIEVNLVLKEGCTLGGTVRDPSGSPAQGATVKATAAPDADQPFCVNFDRSATTDAAGRFSLRGLKRTAHRVEVERTGCSPWTGTVDLSSGAAPPREVHLVGGSDLVGEVLDRSGKPIANSRVFALMEEPRLVRTTNTDGNGQFRVVGLPTNGLLKLRCDPHISIEVALPSPPLTLHAPALADLYVRLVAEESGEPLGTAGHVTAFGPGFSTLLEPVAPDLFHRLRTPAGHYELWADSPKRAVVSIAVDLPEGGFAEPVTIRIPRGGVVRGRVTDLEGRPLAQVHAVAFGSRVKHERRAVTDPAGAYEIRGLTPWAYLVFTAEGLALRMVPLRDTGTLDAPVIVDVKMGVGATVTGRVLRRDTAPLARASVRLVAPGGAFVPAEMPSALSDEGGRFVLRHVPEGPFLVATAAAKKAIDATHGGENHVELLVD